MRPHVFLATPCYGGVVTQGYMQSVLGLMQRASVDAYDLTLALLGQDALITRCRNTLLSHFMQSSATHILFVDSDISFEPELLGRFLMASRDVLGAVYPLKTHYWDQAAEQRIRDGEKPSTAALRYVGELCTGSEARRDGDLATATYAGTGFLLISRTTISRMCDAYPETRYRSIHAYNSTTGHKAECYALFDCFIDPVSESYLSEDFAFCARWRAIGGKVWLDTRSSLTHSGSVEFSGAPTTQYGADPGSIPQRAA